MPSLAAITVAGMSRALPVIAAPRSSVSHLLDRHRRCQAVVGISRALPAGNRRRLVADGICHACPSCRHRRRPGRRGHTSRLPSGHCRGQVVFSFPFPVLSTFPCNTGVVPNTPHLSTSEAKNMKKHLVAPPRVIAPGAWRGFSFIPRGSRGPQGSRSLDGAFGHEPRGCWVSRRALRPTSGLDGPTTRIPEPLDVPLRACTTRILSLSTGARSPIMRPSGTARKRASGDRQDRRPGATRNIELLLCKQCETRVHEKENHISPPFPVSRFIQISLANTFCTKHSPPSLSTSKAGDDKHTSVWG
jgi:hypothetical protein